MKRDDIAEEIFHQESELELVRSVMNEVRWYFERHDLRETLSANAQHILNLLYVAEKIERSVIEGLRQLSENIESQCDEPEMLGA